MYIIQNLKDYRDTLSYFLAKPQRVFMRISSDSSDDDSDDDSVRSNDSRSANKRLSYIDVIATELSSQVSLNDNNYFFWFSSFGLGHSISCKTTALTAYELNCNILG